MISFPPQQAKNFLLNLKEVSTFQFKLANIPLSIPTNNNSKQMTAECSFFNSLYDVQ